MKIEILGPGCPKCARTNDLIAEAIQAEGIDAEIEHITDINEIVDRGVMMTPAVIIDGVVKMEGKVPRAADIKKWLD